LRLNGQLDPEHVSMLMLKDLWTRIAAELKRTASALSRRLR